VWADTDNVNLWLEFSNAALNSLKWRTPKEFCCEEGIEYLKIYLKKFI
jgi:hypothetical protein